MPTSMKRHRPKDLAGPYWEFPASDIFPVISLFSGCGGLDAGFEMAGFTPVFALDIKSAACKTFKANHPFAHVVRADLSKKTPRYVIERLGELPDDAKPVGVIGGPPCQAFSVGNGNKRDDDPRAKLSEKYAEVLKELNDHYALDFFVFENVVGLKHKKHAETFARFKRLFKRAGFNIFETELNAADFGVAQTRKRVFVVGFNTKYHLKEFEFPKPKRSTQKTVRQVIEGLPQPKYFKRGLSSHDISFHPNHWCMRPKSRKFKDGELKPGQIKGRPFRVLNWDKPSWTVAYGNREVHVHPNGRRRLSVYEAMLLQGFPGAYLLAGNLSEQIRLISDAVPPPLAHALAGAISRQLTSLKRRGKSSRAGRNGFR